VEVTWDASQVPAEVIVPRSTREKFLASSQTLRSSGSHRWPGAGPMLPTFLVLRQLWPPCLPLSLTSSHLSPTGRAPFTPSNQPRPPPHSDVPVSRASSRIASASSGLPRWRLARCASSSNPSATETAPRLRPTSLTTRSLPASSTLVHYRAGCLPGPPPLSFGAEPG
jgi:hypothetical protein